MGDRCQRAVKWWQPQCAVRHGCTFHGMKRVDKVWDVPERQTVHVDLVDTLSSVKQACRDLGLRVEACNIPASVVNSSLPFSEHSFLRRTQEVYKEYTADMVLEEGEVLVPDDRQKKHMWLVPCLVYQWFLFHFACLAVSWERAYITVDVADEWCRACLSVLLPPALLKFLSLDLRRCRRVVPYNY